jgi:hypothetical protein
VMKHGRRFGRPPNAFQPPPVPGRQDQPHRSGLTQRQTSRGWVQGYNAQLVTTQEQIVIAAEVNVDSPDFGHLEPMVTAAVHRACAGGRRGVARGGARRRRLLAPGPDGAPRLRRHGRCSFRPMPRNAAPHGRAGTAGSMPSCAACWPPSTAARSTPSARSWSSPCSPIPNSTVASTASCAAAGPPQDPNGGSPTRPTTCSSFGATQRRQRPEGRRYPSGPIAHRDPGPAPPRHTPAAFPQQPPWKAIAPCLAAVERFE